MIRMLFGSDGVIAVPAVNGQTLADARSAPTFAESKITFGSNGSITWYSTLSGSQAYGDGWYFANITGIGSLFWIRATLNSGDTPAGMGFSVWLSLVTDSYWSIQWNSTSPGSSTANLTIEIATDSGGTNIVSSATFDLTASSS